MDVRDWLKVVSLVGGIVCIGLAVTVGVAHSALLLPLGVGLVTSAGVRSTGVTGLVAKVQDSLRPPQGPE